MSALSEERALEALQKLRDGAVFESLVSSYSTQNIITRFGPKGWVGWFKIGDVLETAQRTAPHDGGR